MSHALRTGSRSPAGNFHYVPGVGRHGPGVAGPGRRVSAGHALYMGPGAVGHLEGRPVGDPDPVLPGLAWGISQRDRHRVIPAGTIGAAGKARDREGTRGEALSSTHPFRRVTEVRLCNVERTDLKPLDNKVFRI
jgi:hypothetical protein